MTIHKGNHGDDVLKITRRKRATPIALDGDLRKKQTYTYLGTKLWDSRTCLLLSHNLAQPELESGIGDREYHHKTLKM